MSDFVITITTIAVIACIVITYGKIKASRKPYSFTEKKHVRFTNPVEDFRPTIDLTESDPITEDDPSYGWDFSFGVPLMSKEEKQDYVKRMQQNHDKLKRAMDDFDDFQYNTDDIIMPDNTLDPFRPDHRSDRLNNMTIQEIYDEMTATVKVKPKKILKTTKYGTTYANEKDINGGIIDGTDHLKAFDGISETQKTALFSDEFHRSDEFFMSDDEF